MAFHPFQENSILNRNNTKSFCGAGTLTTINGGSFSELNILKIYSKTTDYYIKYAVNFSVFTF